MKISKLLNIEPSSWNHPDPNGFYQIALCKALILIVIMVAPIAIWTGLFVRHEVNLILFLELLIWLVSIVLYSKVCRISQVRRVAIGYFSLFTFSFLIIMLQSPVGDAAGIYHFVAPLILSCALLLGLRNALVPTAVFLLLYLSVIGDVWPSLGLDPIGRVAPKRVSLFVDRSIELLSVIAIACVYEMIKTKQQDKIREQNRLAASYKNLESISSMAGGIAHEINNPLAIISLSLDILEDNHFQQESCQVHIPHVQQAVTRITHIVKKIMEIHHRPSTELTTFPIEGLVDALWHDLTIDDHLAQQKHIKPRLTLEPPIVFLYTDEQTLAYILRSVLTNALEATMELEHAEIHVDGREEEDTFVLTISDNGPDVSAEELSQFAEPFYSTKMDAPGRGLGLTMVTALVTQIGGKFSISRSEGWTHARLVLPRGNGATAKAA